MAERVVLVTGAAGNVGAALVAALAKRGVRVAAVDRPGHAPAGADGSVLVIPAADLSRPEDAAAAVATALERFGRLDGVAHTVGSFAFADIAATPRSLWDEMLRLNLFTTLEVFRAALPHVRAARGSLVAVGAGAAMRAPSGMAAYAASKSALLRLVESMADELRPAGVRVNAVLPGTIDTPQNRAAMPDADRAAWVAPGQVAAAMAFLLLPDADGVTGALLPVDAARPAEA
jgi:NAD(P)-dependent dehydrogenase (short-subunit alcohol dehydrogenase family)